MAQQLNGFKVMKIPVFRIQLKEITLRLMSILLTGHVLFASQNTLANGQTNRSQFVDVVFDLDSTLINPTTPELAASDPEGTVLVNQNLYRFTDHVVQIIADLYAYPEVRISFFSGGDSDRNHQIVKILYDQVHQKNPGVTPYRILSFDDLTVVSDDPTLSFSKRYKKDLSRFYNLSSTVLVDDNTQFAMPGQEGNLLWIGKVYRDIPRYELINQMIPSGSAMDAHLPPNKIEWKRERNKLILAEELLIEALHKAANGDLSFVDAIKVVQSQGRKCVELFSAAQ